MCREILNSRMQSDRADRAALLRRKTEIQRRLAHLRSVDLPNAQLRVRELTKQANEACGSEEPAKLLMEQCAADRSQRHSQIRDIITAVHSAIAPEDIQAAPGITDKFLNALSALPQCRPSYPGCFSTAEPSVPADQPTVTPDLPTAAPPDLSTAPSAEASAELIKQLREQIQRAENEHHRQLAAQRERAVREPAELKVKPPTKLAPPDPLSAAAQAAVPEPTGARFRKRAPARLSIPDGPGAFARSVMASAPPMHCGLEGVQLLADPPRELPNSARSCHSIESYSSC